MARGTDDITREAAKNAERVEKATKKSWAHAGGLKQALYETVGPLGMMIFLSTKFLLGLGAILKASQLIGRSLEAWARVQVNLPSFARLLGSMGEAKKRMGDLMRMSASGPFKFDSLLEANKRLQMLTRGAAAGKRSMEQVADAAARAGISPEAAAGMIGSAKNALASGRLGSDEIAQLGEAGVLSREAADALVNMANSGAGASAVMAALNGALDNNKGSAEALRDTIYGLRQQLEEVANKNLVGIGQMFSEAKMQGMEAGLELLKAYGPVLQELLKPVASIASGLSWFAKVLADILTFEPVVSFFKVLARSLVALAAYFAATGIRIFARDMMGLMKIVGVAAASFARFTGVTRLLSAALMGLWRSMRGVGAAVAGLAILAEVMRAFGEKKGGFEGDFLTKTADEIKKSNEETRRALDEGAKSVGEKTGLVVQSQQNLEEARKRRKMEEAGGPGVLDAAVDVGVWGLAGKSLIGKGRWGTVAGLAIGAGSAAYKMYDHSSKVKDSKDAEAVAKANLEEVYRAESVTPSDYLNDPDYARAKAVADERLAALKKERDVINQMPDGAAREARIKKNDEATAAVAYGVSPEQLAEQFNKRMQREGAKVSVARAIAQATGDKGAMMEAQRREIELGMERRKKDLILNQHMSGAEADKISRAEGLGELQNLLLNNSNVFASGRQSVGGGVAEGYGGIPPEFQKVIDEIRAIRGDVEKLDGDYEVPERLQ